MTIPIRPSPVVNPSPSTSTPAYGRQLVSHTPLSAKELGFVEEYMLDLDPEAAALRSNLLPQQGRALLSQPRIQNALAMAKHARVSRTQIYTDEVLRRWNALAKADPSEIAPVWRVNCRHCWGEEHEYQFDDIELRHALSAHRANQQQLPDDRRVPFDDKGGSGFDRNRAPCRGPTHPDVESGYLPQTADHNCPACSGDGLLKAFIRDTRYLSPAGRLLFDGFKSGAGGTVEVKLRDRNWAETMLAKHHGLLNERRPIEEFDPNSLSNDQLDAIVVTLAERGIIEIESQSTDADAETSDAEYDEVAVTDAGAAPDRASSDDTAPDPQAAPDSLHDPINNSQESC